MLKFIVKASDLLEAFKELGITNNKTISLIFTDCEFFLYRSDVISSIRKAAVFSPNEYHEIILTNEKLNILTNLLKLIDLDYLIVFRFDNSDKQLEISVKRGKLEKEIEKANEYFRELAKN